MILHNKLDKFTLKKNLANEDFKRITVSFYKYVYLNDLELRRNEIYFSLSELQVLGRIYLAAEGINAQVSVPENKYDQFRAYLDSQPDFYNIPFKYAVEDDGKSFYKLIVRLKNKIVADGLDDHSFDVTNVGRHLTASEWNRAMEADGSVVVDMRNHYESEVGHFHGALLPDADTFKQELPMVINMLAGKEKNKILLYCTGGVRCEKASAYLRSKGFEDVNQLHGGIIDYFRQVKSEKLECKFTGKNFVFDERLGERITDEIISHCHQCGVPCDTHTNCANDDCHLLFIQCPECRKKFNACCSEQCNSISQMPVEMQRIYRRGKIKKEAHAAYKSRLRPKLNNPINV